ncbi:hypothetical protein, partial [Intestinimonas butyriciproducens]
MAARLRLYYKSGFSLDGKAFGLYSIVVPQGRGCLLLPGKLMKEEFHMRNLKRALSLAMASIMVLG